jgi:ribosomal protein S6--L-glutamate ligase
MILSYHPCFVGDQNLLCAGREPDETDRAAIGSADAVILPQGCVPALYNMATRHCTHVFPNYEKRLAYPGKIGQARLFREFSAKHPQTATFSSLSSIDDDPVRTVGAALPTGFSRPIVFKFDWGGEGDNVMRVDTPEDLGAAIEKAAVYERSGQKGFLIQEYIPAGGRSLRVVVIGDHLTAYWRVQTDEAVFSAGISKGAVIDATSDPELLEIGMDRVRRFCGHTGINLAGFDLLFADRPDDARKDMDPYFLEINYFFGRTGLGGSLRFYELLCAEIDAWLNRLGLAVTTDRRPCDTAYNGEDNSGEMISDAHDDKQDLSSPRPEN